MQRMLRLNPGQPGPRLKDSKKGRVAFFRMREERQTIKEALPHTARNRGNGAGREGRPKDTASFPK